MAIIKTGTGGATQWTIDPTSYAGRVTLYDSLGNALASVLDPLTSTYQLAANIKQNVFASTLNSHTASISNGVTWTGGFESTLGVAGIQINSYMDQPHTIYVDQSSDGIHWDLTNSWQIPANFGRAITVQAVNAFYQVRVTNTGASPSGGGNTRITTCLCPVVEAVPQSLTQGGNMRVTVSADWQNPRTISGLYTVSSFRTLGSAASPQNLFVMANPSANTYYVALRTLSIMSDSTALLTSVAQQAQLSKPASLPTGGTALTPVKYRTGYAGSTINVLGATASDGGVATAISATPGTIAWQQFLDRPHSVAGWFTHPGYSLLPDVGADLRQLILAPGESILVQIVGSAPATTHMFCQASWTEFLGP